MILNRGVSQLKRSIDTRALRYLRKWQSFLCLALMLVIVLTSLSHQVLGEAVTVRVNRWLLLQQLKGNVTYIQGNRSRAARVGDRLQNLGDGVATNRDSEVTLEVDTLVGTIEVAENTEVKIQSLEITPSDGRVTRLQVAQGRVRLKIRPFTNPDSRLEIETPAGISGVRGTEFGVNVFPSGKMGVATLDGNVVTAAAGEEVEVPAGFQNVTLPGEPPSQPVPFSNEPRLDYQIERTVRRGIRRLRLIGQVDPTSTVLIQDQIQPIDRDGRFSIALPARSRLRIAVTVITALGQEQTYDVRLI